MLFNLTDQQARTLDKMLDTAARALGGAAWEDDVLDLVLNLKHQARTQPQPKKRAARTHKSPDEA